MASPSSIMSASFLEAVRARAAWRDVTALPPPPSSLGIPSLINCVMLVRWPQRRDMIQDAIASFLIQDHPRSVLTIVNDGAPCRLTSSFYARCHSGCHTACRVISAPAGASIGHKRTLGAAAVPDAVYIASFDDDDFSLPHRLSSHVHAMEETAGGAVWLSASRKYVTHGTLEHVVGFEMGRCYGAGMVAKRVVDAMHGWPDLSWCEDHKLYEAVCKDARFGGGGGSGGAKAAQRIIDDDTLAYVHRRHETNASAPHRQNLWQGVMPLQLAGSGEALSVAATLKALLAEGRKGAPYLEDDLGGPPNVLGRI